MTVRARAPTARAQLPQVEFPKFVLCRVTSEPSPCGRGARAATAVSLSGHISLDYPADQGSSFVLTHVLARSTGAQVAMAAPPPNVEQLARGLVACVAAACCT